MLNKFYEHLDNVSISSPHYEKMTVEDLKSIASVYDKIKDLDQSNVFIFPSESSDHRSWDWEIKTLRKNLKKAIVKYVDKNTGITSEIEVLYIEDYTTIECYIEKTGYTFTADKSDIVKKLQ